VPDTIAFVDPGPNLTQYLSAVGARLGPEYRAVFFSCHVKSRSLLHRLGHAVHPARRRGAADRLPEGVRIDAEQLLSRLRKVADADLVRRQDPFYCWLVWALVGFFDTVRPAGLFVWNGSGLAAAVAEQVARARGLPIVFGENGYLPGTLQLDSRGVNAFASIGRDLSLGEIRALTFTDDQVRAFEAVLADYRAGLAPRRAPPPGGRVRPSWSAYLIQALLDLRERDRALKGNRLVPRGIPVLPERFVLFPLQVRSDSQLTVHSPIYGNRLDHAIADVAAALRLVDPGMGLAVKLHPADLGKTDYDAAVRAHPDLVWIGGGDVRDLLRRAAGVVTVNSTVGIEALIFGKPVVALGRNFYVRDGLVYPVRHRSELRASLERALSESPDPGLVRQYLLYLYFVAFVRGHWRDFSPESLNNVAARIVALMRGRGPV
jgi:capsular polysaccharide export protein